MHTLKNKGKYVRKVFGRYTSSPYVKRGISGLRGEDPCSVFAGIPELLWLEPRPVLRRPESMDSETCGPRASGFA